MPDPPCRAHHDQQHHYQRRQQHHHHNEDIIISTIITITTIILRISTTTILYASLLFLVLLLLLQLLALLVRLFRFLIPRQNARHHHPHRHGRSLHPLSLTHNRPADVDSSYRQLSSTRTSEVSE